MREEQSRYLKGGKGSTKAPPPDDKDAKSLDGEGNAAGGLHPSPATPPRVLSTTGNPEELQGELLGLHKSVESIEVAANRAEQLVMQKDASQVSPQNHAQVQPNDESATLVGRLQWLNHRLHAANDRLTQAMGRLQSL